MCIRDSCYNCATLSETTCRCKCARGWHGTDCSARKTDDAEEGKCDPVYGPGTTAQLTGTPAMSVLGSGAPRTATTVQLSTVTDTTDTTVSLSTRRDVAASVLTADKDKTDTTVPPSAGTDMTDTTLPLKTNTDRTDTVSYTHLTLPTKRIV